MGLDVHLYQFKDVDTEAILKFWKHSQEPWVYYGSGKWKAKPLPERGNFSSDKDWVNYREHLRATTKEAGLPEQKAEEGCFGGEEISFPSKQHPEWPVGEWHSFSTVRGIMEHFTGHDIYFILPEAKDVYGFFRPDWAASRKRLREMLKELQELTQEQKEDYHDHFIKPHIPQNLAERWKNVKQASGTEIIAVCLAQMEVMIETLDFVLNSGNPREFLLYWSD